MARRIDKDKAIRLRKQGYSYSQIKDTIGVGKGTLSGWLADYPLPDARIRELRDWSQQRIEHYRETRKKSRDAVFEKIYQQEKKKILPFSKRDLFIAGLFMYFCEGSKTQSATVQFTNTDPTLINAFLQWLEILGSPRKAVIIRLHLYQDMDIAKETLPWSKALDVSQMQFKNPYIKKSSLTGLTYKNGVGHGTCNAIVWDAKLWKRITMGLKVLREQFTLRP